VTPYASSEAIQSHLRAGLKSLPPRTQRTQRAWNHPSCPWCPWWFMRPGIHRRGRLRPRRRTARGRAALCPDRCDFQSLRSAPTGAISNRSCLTWMPMIC